MNRLMKAVVAAGICAAILASSGSGAWAQENGDALYRDLGEMDGIRKIIDEFKRITLVDPRIKDSFKDSDIPHLKMRLAEQFCALAGGPCKYGGKDMTTIHEDLGITIVQFNALTEDLQLALDRNGIPYRVQNRLIARLAPMQREVVTK